MSRLKSITYTLEEKHAPVICSLAPAWVTVFNLSSQVFWSRSLPSGIVEYPTSHGSVFFIRCHLSEASHFSEFLMLISLGLINVPPHPHVMTWPNRWALKFSQDCHCCCLWREGSFVFTMTENTAKKMVTCTKAFLLWLTSLGYMPRGRISGSKHIIRPIFKR